MAIPTTKSLSTKEFAARYKMNRSTIYRLTKRGALPFFRIGKKVFILPINERDEAKKCAK